VKHNQDFLIPAIPSGRRALSQKDVYSHCPRRKTRHSLTQKRINRWKRDLRRAVIIKNQCRLYILTSISGIPLYISFIYFFILFRKHKQNKKSKYINREKIISLNLSQ